MQAFKLLSITSASLVGAALLASVDHGIGFCIALAFLLCFLATIAFSLFILQLAFGFHPTTPKPSGYQQFSASLHSGLLLTQSLP